MKSRNVKEIFHSFIGTWNIKRTFDTEPIGQGIATFELINTDNIRYREDINVKYHNSSNIYQAYKEYLYIYYPNKDTISKYFVYSTHFHDLEFDNTKYIARGLHLCNQDCYKAEYRFLTLGKFTITYEVLGPKKFYIIYTEFTKLAIKKEYGTKE